MQSDPNTQTLYGKEQGFTFVMQLEKVQEIEPIITHLNSHNRSLMQKTQQGEHVRVFFVCVHNMFTRKHIHTQLQYVYTYIPH
jgi:hypothetical protein